jgi:hypothetical protein
MIRTIAETDTVDSLGQKTCVFTGGTNTATEASEAGNSKQFANSKRLPQYNPIIGRSSSFSSSNRLPDSILLMHRKLREQDQQTAPSVAERFELGRKKTQEAIH